jgi:hypothetical protein
MKSDPTFHVLRKQFHQRIGERIVRFASKARDRFPNFADGDSRSSVAIAKELSKILEFEELNESKSGQNVGREFEKLTCEFLKQTFNKMHHIRPGQWEYITAKSTIYSFCQYTHLRDLSAIIKENRALASSIGLDYLITPDIVIARRPLDDKEINSKEELISPNSRDIATLTPLRRLNLGDRKECLVLHAVASCKWTIRSDRSQNTRTEAIHLIRNRKGHTPHIVAIVAEPLPTRIASLAMGTGELDCVYHFALTELREACQRANVQDQLELLEIMIQGNRLRDISDLPFDLAI